MEIKIYNALLGVTTLGVLLQAVIAGVFMSIRTSHSHHTWVDVHNVVGWITVAAGIVTALIAIWGLRATSPAITGATVVLAIALVVESILGLEAGDASWTVAVHVPLAMIIFGLVIWLSAQGAHVRRAGPTGAAAA